MWNTFQKPPAVKFRHSTPFTICFVCVLLQNLVLFEILDHQNINKLQSWITLIFVDVRNVLIAQNNNGKSTG